MRSLFFLKKVANLHLLPGAGIQKRQVFEVKTGLNFIGNSGESNDIRISVYGVSSIHALIGKNMCIFRYMRPPNTEKGCTRRYSFFLFVYLEVSPDGREHFVEDLASTNGTTIGSSCYRLTPFRLYQISDGKALGFEPANCRYEILYQPESGSPNIRAL